MKNENINLNKGKEKFRRVRARPEIIVAGFCPCY